MGPTVSHTLGSVIRADEDHCVARFRRKVEQEFQIVPKQISANGLTIFYQNKKNHNTTKRIERAPSIQSSQPSFATKATSESRPKSRSGIDCKSKLFVKKNQQPMRPDQLLEPTQFVMKTLDCDYDTTLALSSLLKDQGRLKNKNGMQKMCRIMDYQCFSERLFCESRMSIILLFESVGYVSLRQELLTMKEIFAEEQLFYNGFHKGQEPQIKKFGYTASEMVEIAKFMLDVSEEMLKDYSEVLEKESLDGRKLFPLVFCLENILLKGTAKSIKDYRYRNIIDATLFYPKKPLALRQNDSALLSGEADIDSRAIFSMGLCLLSCCLLEDCYEDCIYEYTGEVCLSILQEKVERMRGYYDDCRAGSALCEYICSLLYWEKDDWSKCNLKEVKRLWLHTINQLRREQFSKAEINDSADTRQLMEDLSQGDSAANINYRDRTEDGYKSKYSCPQNTIYSSHQTRPKERMLVGLRERKEIIECSNEQLLSQEKQLTKSIKIPQTSRFNTWKIQSSEKKKIEFHCAIGTKIAQWKEQQKENNLISRKEAQQKLGSPPKAQRREKAQIEEIDKKWRIQEPIFQNMPEFDNMDERVFGFEIAPELEGPIPRKHSAVGGTLITHREKSQNS